MVEEGDMNVKDQEGGGRKELWNFHGSKKIFENSFGPGGWVKVCGYAFNKEKHRSGIVLSPLSLSAIWFTFYFAWMDLPPDCFVFFLTL